MYVVCMYISPGGKIKKTGIHACPTIKNMGFWQENFILKDGPKIRVVEGALCPSLLTNDRGAKHRSRNMESEKSNILVMDGHFVTREPIKLQKTETTQNDRNFIRISNFSSKNVFAPHGQSAAPFTAAQGHIVLDLGLLA